MKMTAGRKCKVASILLSTVANPKTGFVTCIPTGTLPTLWGDQMPAHGNKFFFHLFVKSTQYKKLALNALGFTYSNLKSCKPHEKTKHNKSKW